VVVPEVSVSEETWKMSFGKFMEILFYNRSARLSPGAGAGAGGAAGGHTPPQCNHCIRDCHVLSFFCEGYVARFDFVPVRPFSLHIRTGMSFPLGVHTQHALALTSALPAQLLALQAQFQKALAGLEREAAEVLGSR